VRGRELGLSHLHVRILHSQMARVGLRLLIGMDQEVVHGLPSLDALSAIHSSQRELLDVLWLHFRTYFPISAHKSRSVFCELELV